jgi:AcrR family transcriptional regulator
MAIAGGARRQTEIQRMRRREIETAAMRTALRHGFPATSLRTVANEAGVPLGVIHYYFRSKDDLMRRVAARIYEAMMAELGAVVAKYRDPARRIDALVETWLVRATEDWRASLAFVEYWAACVRAGTTDRLYTKTLAGFRALLTDTLAEAGADDPAAAALRLLATISGYSMFYRTKPPDPAERERMLEFAREVAHRAIARGHRRVRLVSRKSRAET